MIALILALGLTLRLISLNQSFWLDEAAQAVLSRTPILNVQYAADFQPPFFYVFSHMWMMFGQSEWFLRLPSVFFGIATIYVTYLLGRELFSKRTGLLAAFLLAIAPFHIYYSQEFRMYSLFTLVTMLAWYFVWQKRWIMLAAMVGISVYIHYFAFIHIAALLLFLLHSKQKRGVGYLCAGLVPFALWVPTFMEQIATSQQLLSLWPTWGEVSNAGFYKFLPLLVAKWTVGMISPSDRFVYGLSVVIFGGVLLLAGIVFVSGLLKEGKKTYSFRMLIYGLIIPILMAWLGGLWLPAATPTRVQFVLPFVYLLVAFACIHSLTRRVPRVVIYICLSIFVAIQLFFSLDYLINTKHHREDWRGAIAFTDNYIAAHGEKQTIALSIFDNKWAPMDWYSKYPHSYKGGSTYTPKNEGGIHTNIVLFTYLFEVFDQNKNVEKKLLQQYNLPSEKDFRGVGIIKLYQSDK